MNEPSLYTHIDDSGRATLTLNRPELHNAFDDALIAELTAALKALEANPAVRVVMLAASGKSFSAGADLNWMRRMADYSDAENLADSRALAALMATLNQLAKPTIALVQGAAYGGGVGLVACCDIAIATPRASFCLSEVKLGLIPAVISPYVVAAIGERAARRYFLTAERFDAAEAQRLGLVHEIVEEEALRGCAARFCTALLENSPAAISAAKRLIAQVAHSPLGPELQEATARSIASIRASREGREGVGAFLAKRKPFWIKG